MFRLAFLAVCAASAGLEIGHQFPRMELLEDFHSMLLVMVFPSNNAKALDEDFQSVAGEEDAFHVHGVQVSFWGEVGTLQYARSGTALTPAEVGLKESSAVLLSITDNYTVEHVWDSAWELQPGVSEIQRVDMGEI
ncbi:unnamed protein product [Effrenium voratum]|nr:unnamed protein product [Effrenium voratum]CAJ1442961.1 unnamed protein product [Effrenium voratum]